MRTFRLAGCVLLCSASLAWADVPPPDLAGCQGKVPGAACQRDDGSAGTCAKATCTRNDYSEGPPPKSVEYECVRCEAGAKVTAPSSEPPKKSGSCAAVPGLSVLALGAWLTRRRRSHVTRRGSAAAPRARPSGPPPSQGSR